MASRLDFVYKSYKESWGSIMKLMEVLTKNQTSKFYSYEIESGKRRCQCTKRVMISTFQMEGKDDALIIFDPFTRVHVEVHPGDKIKSVKLHGLYRITVYRHHTKMVVNRNAPTIKLEDCEVYIPIFEISEEEGRISNEEYWKSISDAVVTVLKTEVGISSNTFTFVMNNVLECGMSQSLLKNTSLSSMNDGKKVATYLISKIHDEISKMDDSFIVPTLKIELFPFDDKENSISVSIDIFTPCSECRLLQMSDITFDARIDKKSFSNSGLMRICNACVDMIHCSRVVEF